MLGRTLEGRYRVESKLGAGGMAEVFLAEDLQEHRKVAVKVMNAQGATPEVARRFKREFDACLRLDHPNVIKLFGFGKTEEGGYFYAMEYLPCPTLAEALKKRGRFREAAALQIVLQMARAFEHFHPKGVVHRDLKPGNVMLDPTGRVIVMDFGLVRDINVTQLTATGTIMGTPQYMSPELLMGERVDGRSDIFQLGTITHELLSGQTAFGGATVPEIGHRILSGIYTPVRKAAADVSPSFENFTLNCLAVRREDRYQDAGEVLADLQRMLLGDDVARRAPAPSAATPTPASPGGAASQAPGPGGFPRTLPEQGRRRPTGNFDKTQTDLAPRLRSGVTGPPGAGSTAVASAVGTAAGRARLVAVGVAVVAVAALAWRLAPAATPTVRELAVSATVDRLEVTWKSDDPYPSKVELLTPVQRVVPGEPPEEATVDHRVVVSGLEHGTAYEFRVLYPGGGGSLHKTAETSRFQLEVVGVDAVPDGVRIAWRSNPPGPARARVSVGAMADYELPAVDGPGEGEAHVVLRSLPEDAREVLVETTLPSGARVATPLSRALEEQVQAVGRRLERVDLGTICTGLADGGGSEIRGAIKKNIIDGTVSAPDTQAEAQEKLQRLHTLGELFDSRIEESGLVRDWRRAAAVSRLAFGTKLLPWPVRQAFLRRVNAVLTVAIFAAFEKIPSKALEPWPWMGDAGVSREPLPGEVEAQQLFLGEGRAERLDVGAPIPLKRWKQRWQSLFKVRDLARVTGAEVAFRLESLTKIGVRLRVNDEFETVVYDDPILPAIKGVPRVTYQRVPVQALREGDNVLTLENESLFARLPARAFEIYEITVRLRRAGRP